MRFNSIRFKISVLFVAILGAILITYSSILYLTLRYTLYREVDYELIMKAEEIRKIINSYLDLLGYDQDSFLSAVKRVINLETMQPSQDKIKEVETRWLQQITKYRMRKDYINFLDINGKLIDHSANLQENLFYSFIKDIKKDLDRKGIKFKNINFKKDELRVIAIPFSLKNKKKYLLQIGTSLRPVILILNNRLLSIAISIPIILFFSGFLGLIFATRILKPVVEVTKTASNITHENLSARVKTKHIDLEMKYLVNAFNDMISRLEESFNYIMEFSSHVAHELKTPLAIIIGESELALRKKHNIKEYKKVIDINLEEAGRMLKSVNDLLLLTKLDYRPDIIKFEQIDFNEFFTIIYKQGELLASPKEIKVNINMPHEQIHVHGDKLHLRRLFFNLLDNAIKYTPKNGEIDIALKCEDKKVMVSISDTGIGISDEDLPEIFNRFFRADTKEQRDEPGSGLGLNIALTIAKIHNGYIQVKSELGKGSTFTVILPSL